MFTTPGAELRAEFHPSQSSRIDQSYLDYIEILKQNGVEINSKLFPSYFKLKNGLEYPGIATKQQFNQNQILVKVPKRVVLSSFNAIDRQQLKQIFEQDFYHNECSWQDRILITYLLYIYGIKQQQNIWYHMVTHLSKDIDILGFWSEDDLDKFKDLTVKSAANQDKQSFEEQWKQFIQIRQKYQILQHSVYNKQNYQWIFIHITSRCFGKSLQFTSMTPFCEFINHHCCNGYYDIQNLQQKQKKINQIKKQNNQIKTQNNQIKTQNNQIKTQNNQIKKQNNQIKKQNNKQNIQNNQIKSQITSQGSYASQDYIQIGQFAYDQIESVPFKWICNQSYDLNQKQKLLIKQLKNKHIIKLQKDLKWDDFTILFVPYMIEMCNLIQNQYNAGRKQFQKALNDLNAISDCIMFYENKLSESYKAWRNKDYSKMVHPLDKMQKLTKRLQFPTQQKRQYDNFILTTGKNDIYKANNQVYFCYGRNSNRTLLLRYGFALEGNKYEHVWLSFEIIDFLKVFPDTLVKLQEKGLSLRRKFKIKYGRLNMELITFFRLNSWSFYGKKSVEELFNIHEYFKQIAILSQLKDALQFRMQQFEGKYDLKDSNLSYHQYFITVYHQQKYKILKQHCGFINDLIKFNELLQNGEQYEKAKNMFSAKQLYIYRHYIEQYQCCF